MEKKERVCLTEKRRDSERREKVYRKKIDS